MGVGESGWKLRTKQRERIKEFSTRNLNSYLTEVGGTREVSKLSSV